MLQLNYFPGKKNIIIYLLILLVLWIAMFSIVEPLKDFPLNDDWSYSFTVKSIVEEGKYEVKNWVASPLLTQTLWGALFCLPFGFSFAATRLSTLVLGYLGIMFLFLIVYQVSKSRLWAILCSLAIMVNPIFFSLSASFMTDVPFFTFFAGSAYFLLLYINKRRLRLLVIGLILALLATFIRQFGFILPISFCFYNALTSKKLKEKSNLITFSGLAITIILYLIYEKVLKYLNIFPENYRSILSLFDMTIFDVFKRMVFRGALICLESGFLLFPLSLLMLFNYWAEIKRCFKYLVVPLFILLIPLAIITFSRYPFGNIFNTTGIGPITTVDIYLYGSSVEPFNIPYLKGIVQFIAFIGSLNLLTIIGLKIMPLVSHPKKSLEKARLCALSETLIIIMFFFYFAIIIINSTFFDRYVLPILLMAIIFIVPKEGVNRRLEIKYASFIIVPFLLVSAIFCVSETKFYFCWNKLRWDAASELIEKGIEARTIDGGFEYNGWFGDRMKKYGGWDTSMKKYAITFNLINGYRPIKSFLVYRHLTGKQLRLYVLKRENK